MLALSLGVLVIIGLFEMIRMSYKPTTYKK